MAQRRRHCASDCLLQQLLATRNFRCLSAGVLPPPPASLLSSPVCEISAVLVPRSHFPYPLSTSLRTVSPFTTYPFLCTARRVSFSLLCYSPHSVCVQEFALHHMCLCSSVCRAWNNAVDSSPVWYELCQTYGIGVDTSESNDAKHKFATAESPLLFLIHKLSTACQDNTLLRSTRPGPLKVCMRY